MGDGANGRILVVDNDVDVQRWIKRAVEGAGYEVTQAVNGALGLDLAGKEKFDLILLDIGMPSMDGRDVLSRLKAHPNTAAVPVLILSGGTDVYDRRLVLELGAEDFLEKPISPNSLILAIRSHIRKARGRESGKQNISS
jgi:DNA-binding response OmpR family regulator